MKENIQFVLVGSMSLLSSFGLYRFGLTTAAGSIEAGLLLFSALILILYTKATQEMKREMVNQTYALLTPSLVITFTGFESQKAKFRLENYSHENIVRNFHGMLFYEDQKVDEQKRQVISHGGTTKVDYPEDIWIRFNNISEEHIKNREKLKFKCYYYDRTGKTLFEHEIKSLHKEPLSV